MYQGVNNTSVQLHKDFNNRLQPRQPSLDVCLGGLRVLAFLLEGAVVIGDPATI
jgi:hypothetical protein